MPLLVIFVITHIIYKAFAEGLSWGGEQSRKAWDASMDHSQRLAAAARDRAAARLNAWAGDPGVKGYAAFAIRMTVGAGKLAGKLGIVSAIMSAKGVGAVVRGVGKGALLSAALAGAINRGARKGARLGAEKWEKRKERKGGSASPRQQQWAMRFKRMHDDIKSSAKPGPDPQPAPDPQPGPAPVPTGSQPGPAPGPGAGPAPGEAPRPPYQAGEATVGEPSAGPGSTPSAAGDPAGASQTDDPSAAIGATSNGGDPMGAVATTGGGNVAQAQTSADQMQFEQAVSYCEEMARRCAQLGELASQLGVLKQQVQSGAEILRADNQVAEAALARWGVSAPSLTAASEMLTSIIQTLGQLDVVDTSMELDQASADFTKTGADIQSRFGHSYETVQAEQIDAGFLNS